MKKAEIYEEAVKAILFAILAILVFILVARIYNYIKPIPEWSKALSNIEKAISTLDEKNLNLKRNANVQLKNAYIVGFKDKTKCPENKDKPNCICACLKSSCINIEDAKEKYCKSIKYVPSDDFKIEPSDKIRNFLFWLEKSGENYILKAKLQNE